MHPNPHEPNNLSDLERRLADWLPAADGLNADALLFAAGRASIRPGIARLLWPGLACALIFLAVFLGVCLRFEHAKRLILAEQVQELSKRAVPDVPSVPLESTIPDEEQVNSYLTMHRILESGGEDWPDHPVVPAAKPDAPPSNPPMLRVGRLGILLDP